MECSNNRPECTKAAIQAHRRTFSLVVTGVDALNIPGGFAAAFFDFDEDVRTPRFLILDKSISHTLVLSFSTFLLNFFSVCVSFLLFFFVFSLMNCLFLRSNLSHS